ncbi:MAG: M23 family metallopeptidase [bacterium]|nr:M23 family metallopeptidase [bacterium]
MKLKLKPFVIPTLYSLAVICFVASMYFIQKVVNESIFKTGEEKDEIKYVDKDITNVEEEIKVISTTTPILKPFTSDSVTVYKNYYDYQADQEQQENSIIYYESTYMQNSGIDYSSEEQFDIISILDGTVTSVKEDSILGTIVEIKHTSDITCIYQSITELTVKNGDIVTQGQVIAKSTTSNINRDLKHQLHFEMIYQGSIVNPELYIGKNIEDL